MRYRTLAVEAGGPVGRLTLNRPERANSMTVEMGEELQRAVGQLRSAADVRVVVVTGAGSHFCAGGDLEEFRRLQREPLADPRYPVRVYLDALRDLHGLGVPVIARINGDAFGGGVALALACDLRVMAAEARMGFVFPRVGLSGADGGITYFLPRMIGQARAMEMLLTGAVLDGVAAREAGVVQRVVAAADLDRATAEWTDVIAKGPPLGVRYTKEGVNRSLSRSLEEEFAFEAQAQAACMASGDHAEGVAALLERRPPRFTGS